MRGEAGPTAGRRKRTRGTAFRSLLQWSGRELRHPLVRSRLFLIAAGGSGSALCRSRARLRRLSWTPKKLACRLETNQATSRASRCSGNRLLFSVLKLCLFKGEPERGRRNPFSLTPGQLQDPTPELENGSAIIRW